MSPVPKFNLTSLIFAKNCKRSEILPDLQANKILCHSFLNADRRHENPGSETKVFITHSNSSSPSISIGPQGPIPTGQHVKGQETPAHAVGCITEEEL